MTYIKRIALCTFLVASLVQAQEKKVDKANDAFENYAFMDAIESYEELVGQGYSEVEIFQKLGNANYFNAQYEEAANWYGKLLRLENAGEIDPEYKYRYAISLKSLGKYEESDQWLKKFQEEKGLDLRAKNYEKKTDYLERIRNNSGRFDIKNLSINSTGSDFSPSVNGDQLVFSSARDTGLTAKRIHLWNKKGFLNLYATTRDQDGELGPVTQFDKKLNSKAHESSIVFTKDGTTAYFTRNNDSRGSFSKDKNGVTRLKLYRATKKNNKWTNITELPFNADDYSVAHPTLSPDETKLYFASDMPGTMGASDIFVVDINGDGSYGTPKNLGPKINTEARESFPYVSGSNVLYFASDGHPGLGGLDIFATRLDEELHIVNVGQPVNSNQDDFSFAIDEETKVGYFASNRKGGKGDDDIYGFYEKKSLNLDCSAIVQGVARNKETGEVISEAEITITDNAGTTIASTISDAQGRFNTTLDCKTGSFSVAATKKKYEKAETIFDMKGEATTHEMELLLIPYVEASKGVDLMKHLDMEPIYFDFDKWHIRKDAQAILEKIILYMKEYPEMKIEIRSHTDSRGDDGYNKTLSEKRAKATMEYIVSMGIDATRLTSNGFGEEQLTNDCKNNVPCSRAKHQLNRRSEFIVVED
ncbi:MAG: OmpA family protein [Flavobacteriaceae bacterium]